MARIHYFKQYSIAIYIYGERYGKHHEKHILVLKADEDCEYGFDGKTIKMFQGVKEQKIRKGCYKQWIPHRKQLESVEDINNGINPG